MATGTCAQASFALHRLFARARAVCGERTARHRLHVRGIGSTGAARRVVLHGLSRSQCCSSPGVDWLRARGRGRRGRHRSRDGSTLILDFGRASEPRCGCFVCGEALPSAAGPFNWNGPARLGALNNFAGGAEDGYFGRRNVRGLRGRRGQSELPVPSPQISRRGLPTTNDYQPLQRTDD